MNLELKRLSQSRSSLKRKSLPDNSPAVVTRKRMQHSLSLNKQLEDVSQCSRLNCFMNAPDQVFSLTYLTENDTLNPESLRILEEFKHGNWQAYLVGLLYNFSYQPAQRKALERAITSGLRTRFQNSKVEMTYHTQVTRCNALSPTENDSEALQITITGRTETKERLLYMGYLISWCSSVKESQPFLPVLLCRGNAIYRDHVSSVVSQKLDVIISRFTLTEEELKYLATYCLIMLDENDGSHAYFTYRRQTGDVIKLGMSVETLLRLWKKIHTNESIDINWNEVIQYHDALDKFYESTFGMKLGNARFQVFTVNRCFGLKSNSMMWFKSTKVIHVVFKYLNHLAIKRLRVRSLTNYFDEGNVEADYSVMPH